ncbi:hypothetical protein KXD40_003823 [Peronospora effusa]|uniref:Uncharacterized protein n=1 Tax=Peronospora effusa TaxID=542832 RepID=A0A3M6VMN1_9STRA|nr:hypothetical protein DD238_000668 [Peronospora effusa]RQM17276.1 hypothetical protein DD237_000725 [Peronospora effusa]UIZ22738.1 hypothetical protein KXD40_003823 [Peronospora effusa]
MDAFLHKIASSMLFTSTKLTPAEEIKQQKPVLLASGSPRLPPLHQSAQRSMQPELPHDLSRRRIAHWDNKREKCANCKHIYLKTLSRHAGFCSVDCKSNMVYLEKVNRTIHAMKDAVQEQRRQKESQEKERQQQELVQQSESQKCDDTELDVMETECKTYAEFGLESRIVEASKVEWAFSAMY